MAGIGDYEEGKPFQLKSGNKTSFKQIGSSPAKQEEKVGTKVDPERLDPTPGDPTSFEAEIHGMGGTRGKSGKTYEQRWNEMSQKEKDKFGSLRYFKASGEGYHYEKDVEAYAKKHNMPYEGGGVLGEVIRDK